MPSIRAFKIWYSDKTFDSTQAVAKDIFGAWQEAPAQDIQTAMFYFNEQDEMGRLTRRVMCGEDFYAIDAAGNLFQDSIDVANVSGVVKFGKFTILGNLERIMTESLDDYGEGWLFPKLPAPVAPINKVRPI